MAEAELDEKGCLGLACVNRDQDNSGFKKADVSFFLKSLVFYHKINEKLMMYFKKEHNILWNHGFERNKTRGRESI